MARRLPTAIGLVAALLVIWWVGPTISVNNVRPFEEEWVRWLLIAALMLIAVGPGIWRLIAVGPGIWRRLRASEALKNRLPRKAPTIATVVAFVLATAGWWFSGEDSWEYLIGVLMLIAVGPGIWRRVRASEALKNRLRRKAPTIAAVVAFVLATAGWWISYAHNQAYLKEVAGQFDEIKKQVAAVPPDRRDLSTLLPILTSVDDLSKTGATPDGSVPWSWRFGLYQGDKLESASEAAHQRMLRDNFLPALAAYLERYLSQDSPASPEESYDTLRTYVMLYDAKHFRREPVWRWYEAHAADLLRGGDAGAGKAFKTHFDALYERGWVEPVIARNGVLIARVRAVIGRDSLATRIYDRLKHEPLPDVRDFTIMDKAGPKAMLVFERGSREPLTKGVPGFYTKDGYYRHFAQRADRVASELADEETWVLGAVVGTPGGSKVAEAVKRLYLEDYRRIWRGFLNDITLRRGRDLTGTIEITQVMSAQDSPLKSLMKAIDRETRLSVPPEGLAARAQEYAGRARQAIGAAPPGSLEKALVDDHFDDVARFVISPGGAPAPMDTLIGQLNDFYIMLVTAKVALDASQSLPPADSANKLRAEAARQPEPIRSMLQSMVERSMRILAEKGPKR